MLTGEEASAGEVIDERARIAARDVDAFAIAVPRHREAMRGVLAGETGDRGEAFRTDVLQADQADAGDRVTVVQLRTECAGKLALGHVGIETVVDQQPPADYAVDSWELHADENSPSSGLRPPSPRVAGRRATSYGFTRTGYAIVS